MKRIIIIGIIVLGIGAIAFRLFENKQTLKQRAVDAMKTNATTPVTVEKAHKQAIQYDFTANGTVAADRVVTLTTESAGKIQKIYKTKGDHVNAGDVIATQVDDAVQANLATAQSDLEHAKKDLDRYKNLQSLDAVTKQQLEQAQLNVDAKQSQVVALQKQLADMHITAPFSGIINNDFDLEPGAFLGVGKPVSEIIDADPLKLKVLVSEGDVQLMSIGDTVEVYSSIHPELKFEGKVGFIAVQANSSLQYPVEIDLSKNASSHLKPGMYAYAHFHYEPNAPVLVISRKSIATSLQNAQVYVVTGDSVQLKNISVRAIDAETVEVLSGLQNGEEIVKTGHINLRNGAKITIE